MNSGMEGIPVVHVREEVKLVTVRRRVDAIRAEPITRRMDAGFIAPSPCDGQPQTDAQVTRTGTLAGPRPVVSNSRVTCTADPRAAGHFVKIVDKQQCRIRHHGRAGRGTEHSGQRRIESRWDVHKDIWSSSDRWDGIDRSRPQASRRRHHW
jgi:hypothetical protein